MIQITIFNFLKGLLNAKPKKESGWRNAAQKSGYGIKFSAPLFSKSINLCSHLNAPETIRKDLESFLIKHRSSRPEVLVTEFMQIVHSGAIKLQFPSEIYRVLNSRRKRGSCTEKQVAAIYIRHELSVLKRMDELNKFRDMSIKKVRIKTCEDGRTCSECKKHKNRVYTLNNLPLLPLCWECRCYYEPQI